MTGQLVLRFHIEGPERLRKDIFDIKYRIDAPHDISSFCLSLHESHNCPQYSVSSWTGKIEQTATQNLFPSVPTSAISLNRTTLLGVHRGVLGVLGVLRSTPWPENRTPDLELLLARTASLVLATRERGLQVQPASIHNAGEETV